MTKRIQALQDYIFVSKYARTIDNKKETWEESVNRVMDMHHSHLTKSGVDWEKLQPFFDEAKDAYMKQEAIGAQRTLQFGGDQLLKHHMKTYNCTSTYANRIEFFDQLMYILLCGAGAGYSVQKHHVAMLPIVEGINKGVRETFVIPDSIEGWGEAVKVVVESHFKGGPGVDLIYSEIRPKGALISGGFKAPGPEPLKKALKAIDKLLTIAAGRQLRPFEVHRMACLIADAVISGGIRRSALIVLFSADDNEMMSAKTNGWFGKYPELARSNNSVVITPDTPKALYDEVFNNVKQFGEPGIAFLESTEFTYNPCFEVGMFPVLEEKDELSYGWSTCNLSEINGKYVKDEASFLKAARAAAILGTFQASYTDFPYLGEVTEKIIRRDALLGVGITGMAENPDILFDAKLQKKIAEIIVKVNIEVAKILGINPGARTSVIKPSGNSSQMLGTASGVHNFHAERYLRNVQGTNEEHAVQIYKQINPTAVTPSSYKPETESVVTFPVEVGSQALFKDDQTAIEFLDNVKLTQQNWIEYGTNFKHPSSKANPKLRHNVSNTVTVKPNEWDGVQNYLWENKEFFTGVSMLGNSGDVDYDQAPYVQVFDEIELSEMYGAASMLASGLIVDGIHAYGNLWNAISTALGIGESLVLTNKDVLDYIDKHLNINDEGNMQCMIEVDSIVISDINAVIAHLSDVLEKKKDWVRRFKKFGRKYLGNDQDKTGRCLKHVSIFHQWQAIKDSKIIHWDEFEWEEEFTDVEELSAQGCYGGACEI